MELFTNDRMIERYNRMIERDIGTMLSNLDEAHKWDKIAKEAYVAQDYQKSIRSYHQCMLYARAVVQLTPSDYRQMARAQQSSSDKDDDKNEVICENLINTIEDPEISSTSSTIARNRLDSTTRGDEIKKEAKELVSKCYNNLAACLLARDASSKDDYMRAVSYCDNVLKEDPDNEKALFRKGVALMKAGKWEKAIEPLELCSKSNAQAKLKILECQRNIEEERRRRDAEIRANFAKARAAAEQLEAMAHNNNNDANANGHPPVEGNGNLLTMNGHVQHQ